MQSKTRNEYLKKFIMLNKIYKDNNKFDGISDNFSFKVTIFLDKCRQVDLPEDAYIQGAFIMLLGQAQTYYYANYSNNFTFNSFCLKMHFLVKFPSNNVSILPNAILLASTISS